MKRFLPFALLALLLPPLAGLLLSGSSPPGTEADRQKGPAVQGQSTPDSGGDAQPLFKTVSVEEAAELIETRDDLQLIDVRTPQERKQFRIANSQLVPVGDVIRGVFKADPEQPLMLICAVGGRSYVASKVMFARGYREIYNLGGGIEAWRRAGLPLLTSPENPPQ